MTAETPIKEPRLRLAYIKAPATDTTSVSLVEYSKTGQSFHYKGTLWNKEHPYPFSSKCLNSDGDCLLIEPLSRHHIPSWVDVSKTDVSEDAMSRFTSWASQQDDALGKKLNSAESHEPINRIRKLIENLIA